MMINLRKYRKKKQEIILKNVQMDESENEKLSDKEKSISFGSERSWRGTRIKSIDQNKKMRSKTFSYQFKPIQYQSSPFEIKKMGQGGSISENKSFILSNWVETKPNSNIFYNKVTNQQIQRHQVLINDKHELSSYASRIHDQSLLICRLIYFHPKSTPKDDMAKKDHVKHPSNLMPQDCNRVKSMLKQPSQLNIQHKSSPKNASSSQKQQIQPKIYCVYTDRMIPVKEWSKDKIIDVIGAFMKLTQVYGLFKVREHCICENLRKEIKIWINEDPVSNFVVETVQSEEDMIADLAAILVSKKEKIAKELLDLQYFVQAIEHFTKLSDYDHKKYLNSGSQNSANTSNRATGFPSASNRQSETSRPSFMSPEFNNFYNVFINTENSYTVSSSLQNSKYNLINKGPFGYPYYPTKGSNQPPPNSKEAAKYENPTKEPDQTVNTTQQKTQNDIKVKRQYSPTQYGLPGSHLTLAPSPIITNTHKLEQKDSAQNQNLPSYNSSMNHVSQSTIFTKDSRKKVNQGSQISHQVHNFGERDLTENTSIMINTKKYCLLLQKNGSLDKEKERHNANREQHLTQKYMINSQKKTPSSAQRHNSNLYSTQAPKPNLMSKFIPSTQQQIKNHSKNNPSGEIAIKGNIATENIFPLDSFGCIKKEVSFNPHINELNRTTPNQKEFFSNCNVEKPGSSIQNYFTPQNNKNVKPGSSFQEKHFEMNRNSGGSSIKEQAVGDMETKSFIRTEYNPTTRSKSKVFLKSYNYEQQNELTPHYQSTRNVVSQMSTLKPPNSLNQNPTLLNTLSKKSFPKYFQEQQSAKSIQKYYEKSLEQREKSRAIIGKVEEKISPEKIIGGAFRGQVFKYQNQRIKDLTQQVVPQVCDSEACSQEIIPPSNWQQTQSVINENYLKAPLQSCQPRRKFPSTTEGKSKKILDIKQFEETQCKLSKQGTQIDSQQSYDHMKSNILSHPLQKRDKQKSSKKLNNAYADETENKSCIMTKSYFSQLNTKNSVLIGNSQYDKQQNQKKVFETDSKKKKPFEKPFETTSKQDDQSDGKFRFKDQERREIQERTEVYTHSNHSGSGPFWRLDEKLSMNLEEHRSRDSMAEIEQNNTRNQSFPYQTNSVIRKNDKQFTFNSNQKPTGAANIEYIHPFEPSHAKGRIYLKKQSIKSVDEQQTLPRTTADERQKRMFKETGTSEVLTDTNELHSSHPGHKIQQIVEKIQRQKQALLMKKNNQQIMEEKLDVKQYPIFKKQQPSMNVFGSLINQQHSYGSCIKKKEYAKSQQEGAHDDKLSVQDSQKDEHEKICPTMVNSQNLQTKKKMRKEVFNDYKGLFGDENPFQKDESAEEKEKARKLEIKKQKEEEERMLENASSKDLLIQEKVQKQKEKHAQLKSDLSKLFTQQV